MVTGKGLSGGMYPIAAALLGERASRWLDEDGFAHMSTFGGAELGCVAAIKALEITSRPEVRESVHQIAAVFADGLASIQADYPDWFVGIRQNGVVIGLEFDHPEGAKFVMRELYENGVWAIFSTLDPRVLQFKPGLLLSRQLCDDVLDRMEVAVGKSRTAATVQS
jgi:acetylornithine/succinyldiaminopimelate/putrescine aminotransferase